MAGQDATILDGPLPVLGLQHNRTRPVAKQDAGGAVVPVEETREGFGPDHQRPLVRARDQKLVRRRNREHKPRAYRLQVKSDAFGHAKCGLHLGCGGGEGIIRRRGAKHDEVDVVRTKPGGVKRALRRLRGEHGGGLPLSCEIAGTDARAFDDPFVRRIDNLFEIRIGDATLWQVGTNPHHDGPQFTDRLCHDLNPFQGRRWPPKRPPRARFCCLARWRAIP